MRHYRNNQTGSACVIILATVALIFLGLILWPADLTSCKRGPIAIAGSDMRTLLTGIESYRVDYNEKLPPNLYCITTPVAHLQTIPKSPFGENAEYSYYYEHGDTADCPSLYIFWCTGPDEKDDLTKSLLSQRIRQERERVGNKISTDSIEMLLYDLAYETSNGTKSSGDVFRVVVDTAPTTTTASR